MQEPTTKFWDFVEREIQQRQGPGGGACGLAQPEGRDTRTAAVPSGYLEVDNKIVTGEEKDKESWVELRPCGCRSWFCPHCCLSMGLKLRERLLPVLQSFTAIQMWTFTVDPRYFQNPQEAYEYIREGRCIARVMRALKAAGHLHSGRYFYVVEWQMGKGDQAGTEFPHFHLLVDASFVPVETVREAWNRFIPAWVAPWEEGPAGFGWVRFSAPKFADPLHAARYACKYLIKHPEKGYPAWVLDFDQDKAGKQIHRYSVSKGFWKSIEEPDADTLAEQASGTPDDNAGEAVKTRQPTTLRQRLAHCGNEAVLLRVTPDILPDGRVKPRRKFLGGLTVPMDQAAAFLGITLSDGQRCLKLPDEQAGILRATFGTVEAVEPWDENGYSHEDKGADDE